MEDAELSYRMSRALVAAGENDAALEMLESLPARYFRIDAGLNWDPGHLYWYRARRSVASSNVVTSWHLIVHRYGETHIIHTQHYYDVCSQCDL